MLTGIIGFLFILAPLVIVHEFGHFLFARLFNVKVLAFSVGFGKVIWHSKKGETDWRVSLIPLGGYVKLLGEDSETELSPEDQKRALNNQEPWKRFLIYLGGPLFNFIWAALVFMAILVIGEPQTSSVLNRVLYGSAAEQAGFRSGDRILSINDEKMNRFFDLMLKIEETPGKELTFLVERPSENRTFEIRTTPESRSDLTIYGERKAIGKIPGIEDRRRPFFARDTKVGISDPQSIAGQAGFRTGDRIVEFAGEKVAKWEEIVRVFRGLPIGSEVVIQVEREHSPSTTEQPIEQKKTPGSKGSSERLEFALKKTQDRPLPRMEWGLHSSELFISQTIADSPAEAAGLLRGDRMVSINGEPLFSFYDLTQHINHFGASEAGIVQVKVERDGKLQEYAIKPNASSERGVLLDKVTRYTIGVAPMLHYTRPDSVTVRIWNPFVLAYEGTKRMLTISYMNLVSVLKLISGSVSIATLGGPIAIGKIAGESIELGLITFLIRMAQLSVGLGILNLLPIPVLDGGHIMLLGVEAIRRKPLSVRQLAIFHQVGLLIILSLMAFVIKNDITRLIPVN